MDRQRTMVCRLKAMHGGKGLTASEMPQVIDSLLKGKSTKRGRDFLEWYDEYQRELIKMQEQLVDAADSLKPETRLLFDELKQHFTSTVGDSAESVLTGMAEEFYQLNPAATQSEYAEYMISELKMWMGE